MPIQNNVFSASFSQNTCQSALEIISEPFSSLIFLIQILAQYIEKSFLNSIRPFPVIKNSGPHFIFVSLARKLFFIQIFTCLFCLLSLSSNFTFESYQHQHTATIPSDIEATISTSLSFSSHKVSPDCFQTYCILGIKILENS